MTVVSVDLRAMLVRAADALHDAAWVMEGAETVAPLPPPSTIVLPQTRRVEGEIRALLAALDAEVMYAQPEDEFVLGRCFHGIDLDHEFCPDGCRA